MADDSGLVVDALDGRPGVRSARYAGEHATDQANLGKLLGEMREVPPASRTPRFACAVAVALPGGEGATFTGSVEGKIAQDPRGDGGFGYAPVPGFLDTLFQPFLYLRQPPSGPNSMTLKERLESDLKTAMRSGDTLRRSVIRLLRSELHNQEIASQSELDDEGVVRVLSRQAQQRRDSIEAYRSGNRQDLVDRETDELRVILEYLPAQMTRDEIEGLVRQVIADTGAESARDMGKVMGALMPQVAGKAEGREVSSIVRDLLGA